MPEQQRRFRRLGATSAVISVSACVLLIGGAPSADAATTCTPGHDAATAIKYLQCLSKQWQDGINKLLHPKPTASPSTKKTTGAKKTRNPTAKRTHPATGKPAAPKVAAPVAGPQGLSLQKVPANTVPQMPLVEPPLPQVAGTAAQVTGARGVETHLLAPVAATQSTPPQVGVPVVATTAAGLAGLVGALNLSIATRRLRKRP